MKTLNFVIIKLTVCLSIGIIIAHFSTVQLRHTFYFILLSFTGLILTYFISQRQYKKTAYFGMFVYVATISLGCLMYSLHDQRNFKLHYTHSFSSENKTPLLFKLKIRKRLKSSLYRDKYVVDVLNINDKNTCGKLLFNVNNDSLNSIYHVDDVLLVSSELSEIKVPLNPNQFNYNTYLKKQYVFHQIFSNTPSIRKLSSDTHTLLGYAAALRDRINIKLKTHRFKQEELTIINALILGQRQDMSKEVYNSYVNAGAIHILAVSGLHVGIILLLLNICLQPLIHLKHGTRIKVCSIIILLWSFAVVAGLSASVTRAVTMFSIVAIAMNWNRPTNIYNTLAISVFILLLFKPMFLFDVGFQMSYLAVLAIVSIQPLLYRIWKPKWKITNYLWQIFTVTVAAQLGVIPISLYYFHQFPGLFFISNLAIIPFLGLILGLGIIVIVLSLFNCLPEILAGVYGNIISLMNSIIHWVSQQESFLLQHISFEIEHVLVSYILIISSIFLYKRFNFKTLSFVLVSILCTQCICFYTSYRHANKRFIVFHKSRHSILGAHINSELTVYHTLDSVDPTNDYIISNYAVGNFIDEIKQEPITSVYQFQNNTILVLDSLSVYNVKSFKPNIVLLRNSPRVNLERVLDSIHPKLIIADGSNYTSYVRRWEKTCLKRKLPFHHTGKKGAYILKE